MTKTVVGAGGSVFRVPGEAWTVAALAMAGTFLLVVTIWPFSSVAYLLAMVAQVLVAPIPSVPVSLVGVLVFGFGEGLALGLAGSVVGSALAFVAVRWWGSPWSSSSWARGSTAGTPAS